MEKKSKNRWNLLVYPKFQLTLLAVYGVILTTTLGGMLIQILRSFDEIRSLGQNIDLPQDHAYFQFIEFQAATLLQNFLVAGGVALIGGCVLTLLVSHRLAGPFLRLRGYFEDMHRNGWRAPLKFRDGDFFEDIPAAINQAIEPYVADKKKGIPEDRAA